MFSVLFSLVPIVSFGSLGWSPCGIVDLGLVTNMTHSADLPMLAYDVFLAMSLLPPRRSDWFLFIFDSTMTLPLPACFSLPAFHLLVYWPAWTPHSHLHSHHGFWSWLIVLSGYSHLDLCDSSSPRGGGSLTHSDDDSTTSNPNLGAGWVRLTSYLVLRRADDGFLDAMIAADVVGLYCVLLFWDLGVAHTIVEIAFGLPSSPSPTGSTFYPSIYDHI